MLIAILLLLLRLRLPPLLLPVVSLIMVTVIVMLVRNPVVMIRKSRRIISPSMNMNHNHQDADTGEDRSRAAPEAARVVSELRPSRTPQQRHDNRVRAALQRRQQFTRDSPSREPHAAVPHVVPTMSVAGSVLDYISVVAEKAGST